MKTKIIILATATLLFTSCYQRLGKLTIVSTRNFESKTEYVLIEKDITAKAKVRKGQAMETAIDKVVAKYKTGEFMKNVVIEVRRDGKKVRVTGDVWGTAKEK